MRKNNKSYDLRLDIPARIFINSMILERVQRHKFFNEIKEDILKKLIDDNDQINSYNLFDQSYVASLLYCVILTPKEVMKLSENDMLFQEMDKLQPSSISYFVSFEIGDAPIKKNSYWIVRLLRNSIAHTLYKIDTDNNWDFWNLKNIIR